MANILEVKDIKEIEQKGLLGYRTANRLGVNLMGGMAIGSLLAALFAWLAYGLVSQELDRFDTLVGGLIRSRTGGGWDTLAILITNIGSAIFEIGLFIIVAGYFWYYRKRVREALMLAVGLAGGYLLNTALKHVFQRPRPEVEHLVAASGYSFPSGHMMMATIFYGMLGYLAWLGLRQREQPGWYVPVLTFILIAAIGASRIYLGVHFPSDVTAGFAAGGVWLLICLLVLDGIKKTKRQS
ncbi:MAG: phosphatase PAP2 family protein [Peptococcaceae bacterium]|nr:phosphatase PAP2 family protein [Peptococcaceae bacterium]